MTRKFLPIVRVKLVKEETPEYLVKAGTVRGSEGVWKIFEQIMEESASEEFWVMALDAKHKPLHLSKVSTGSLTASIVHPREAMKSLVLANAHAAILGHNHPSGDPTPSEEDYALTRRLVEAGALLGIKILDHVIVGEGRFYSFADHGEINQ